MRSNCRAWHKGRRIQEGQGGPGTVSLLSKTLFADCGCPEDRWVLTALHRSYLHPPPHPLMLALGYWQHPQHLHPLSLEWGITRQQGHLAPQDPWNRPCCPASLGQHGGGAESPSPHHP